MPRLPNKDVYRNIVMVGGRVRVKRPNSKRLVHPVAECNRLLDRIRELESQRCYCRELGQLSKELRSAEKTKSGG